MLKVENITKKYGNKIIIDNFSYTFQKGKYQIIGNNGAGKSTLLKIITGMDNCYTGRVIFEQDYSRTELLYNIVEYVAQNITLIQNKSVIENMNMINKLDTNKFKNLAKSNNIELNEKIKNLSGGQQQKISILIGVCSLKSIVIFDEPFNNLDMGSISKFDALINEMENDTIILVNHESIALKTPFKKINLSKKNDTGENFTPLDTKLDKSGLLKYLKIIKSSFLLFLISTIITLLMCIGFVNQLNFNPVNAYFYDNDLYYFETSEEIKELESIYPYTLYDPKVEGTLIDDTILIEELDFSNHPSSNIYLSIEALINSNIETINIVELPLYNKKSDLDKTYTFNYQGIEYLLYGEYPDDNSNEIIVDELIALSISPNDIEKAVGQTIKLNNQIYVISGIFVSDDYSSASYYTSYTNKIETEVNGYYCYNECEKYESYNLYNNSNVYKGYLAMNKTSICTIILIVILFILLVLFFYYVYRRNIKEEIRFMNYKGITKYYIVDYIFILICIAAIIIFIV